MIFFFLLTLLSTTVFSAQDDNVIKPAGRAHIGALLSDHLKEECFEKIFNQDTVCCGSWMRYAQYNLIFKFDSKKLGLSEDKLLILHLPVERKFFMIPSRKLYMSPDLKQFVIDTIAQQKDLKNTDALKAKIDQIPEGELGIFKPFID